LSIKKRTPRVRKPTGRKPRLSAGKPHPVGKKAEIETLVKAGVERFILKDATMDDFLRTIRTASAKEFVYSHQLTKSLFSKIVKQAIRKRNQRLKKAAQL